MSDKDFFQKWVSLEAKYRELLRTMLKDFY